MSRELPSPDIGAIAAEVVNIFQTTQQTTPFSQRYHDFTQEKAYQVTSLARNLLERTYGIPIGRKIGFTNRDMWAEYNIDRPIWGYMWRSTVRDLAFDDAAAAAPGIAKAPCLCTLAPGAELKIEAEIVLGLAASPRPGMSDAELLACLAWIAPGFEVVNSIFPGWRFGVADTIAGFGLHSQLWIGRRVSVSLSDHDAVGGLGKQLESFKVTLLRDGEKVADGGGAMVLGSPIKALGHLVELLARDSHNSPLRAGEIITTGTLTRALTVRAGEVWATEMEGVPLEGLSVRFVDSDERERRMRDSKI